MTHIRQERRFQFIRLLCLMFGFLQFLNHFFTLRYIIHANYNTIHRSIFKNYGSGKHFNGMRTVQRKLHLFRL